jgi:hypothetical protein
MSDESTTGYTKEEWLDWLPDLLTAIGEGIFDDHLRELAKAAIDRKKDLDMGLTQQAAVAYSGPVVGEGAPCFYTTYGTTGTILYRDQRFSKAQMEGKVVRLTKTPENGLPWYYDNVLIEITGVGNKNVKARFAGDPRPHHPTSTELEKGWRRQEANADAYLAVSPEFFPTAFPV